MIYGFGQNGFYGFRLLKVSCYRITLEKLCILGVRFNMILYFNKLFIKLHLPECIVPIKIIQELRRAVKLDLK